MRYDEFINGINTGAIKRVVFSISEYAHYRNCIVESKLSDPNNKNSLRIIWVYLTTDDYEKKGFLNEFKENVKLFNFKKKGQFTLKQVWNRVKIHSVEYSIDANSFPIDP